MRNVVLYFYPKKKQKLRDAIIAAIGEFKIKHGYDPERLIARSDEWPAKLRINIALGLTECCQPSHFMLGWVYIRKPITFEGVRICQPKKKL